ncbi:MAG TPA: hypothetical protein PKU93_02080 [Candidatus Pacearchaeota archaeon]|nr:hypothetical protein [Candidatus Pacearchaeota archaeon]
MNAGCVLVNGRRFGKVPTLKPFMNVQEIQAELFLDLMQASGFESFFVKESNEDFIVKIQNSKEEKILRNLMQVFINFACPKNGEKIVDIYIEKNKGNQTWLIRGEYKKDLCAWLSEREHNFDKVTKIMRDMHLHVHKGNNSFVRPEIFLGPNAHLIIAWSNFKGIFPLIKNWELGEGREFYSTNLEAKELVVLVAGLGALQNMYIREKIFLHKKSPNYLR